MASLDQIVDRVREESGADFAFILTRRGRLATRNAPSDMPQEGRAALVELAEELLDSRRDFAHIELPRETLVPFGGAAPVDVYVAAREEAILCVVMATFVSQDRVGPAVAWGVGELDALLDTDQRRLRRRGLKARPPNPKSSSGKRRRTGEFALDFDDEGGRGTIPFLAPYKPVPKREESAPEITVRDASVGRATLAAIEVDAQSPEIVYGMSPIGRHTIAEIERSVVPEGDPKSSIPDIRVNVVTMPEIASEELDVIDRQTLPFTENAAAAKRAFDARESPPSEHPVTVSTTAQRTVIVGRSGSGPRLKRSLREERPSLPDMDDTIPDAMPAGLRPASSTAPKRLSQSPPAPSKPRSILPAARKSVAPKAASSAPPAGDDPMIESKELGKDERVLRQLRDSNIEAWHQALGEIDAPERERGSSPPPRTSDAPPKRHTRPPSAAFPKRKTLSPPKRRDS